MQWWLWGAAAVLSAGSMVTSVVIATRPHSSLNVGSTAGAGATAVTVRF